MTIKVRQFTVFTATGIIVTLGIAQGMRTMFPLQQIVDAHGYNMKILIVSAIFGAIAGLEAMLWDNCFVVKRALVRLAADKAISRNAADLLVSADLLRVKGTRFSYTARFYYDKSDKMVQMFY